MAAEVPGHLEEPNGHSWRPSAASALIFGVGTVVLAVVGFPAGIVAICGVIGVLSAVQTAYRWRVSHGGGVVAIASAPAAPLLVQKVVWTPVFGSKDRYVADVDGVQWSLRVEVSNQGIHYTLEQAGRAVYEAAALPVRWRLLEFPMP